VESVSLGGMTVLVVDDQLDARELLADGAASKWRSGGHRRRTRRKRCRLYPCIR
jgi:hypothetical protein